MKKLVLIFLLLMSFGSGNAQTWDEWFKQGKTQKRYLIKQIALLNTYLGYVKKGVTVVQHGLRTIENGKNGEFNLHRDFFSYLSNVNPVIANSAKVADIIAYQMFIMRQLNAVNKYCRSNKHFTAEEVRYVTDVYANMLILCDANLSELLTIIKPDKTKMTDDERLKRIDFIYEDTLDKHRFVQSFGQDVRYISLNRAHELYEIGMINKYYE